MHSRYASWSAGSAPTAAPTLSCPPGKYRVGKSGGCAACAKGRYAPARARRLRFGVVLRFSITSLAISLYIRSS